MDMMRTEKLVRVHRVNRPLEVGEELLVPCASLSEVQLGEVTATAVVPVLWPPHDDPETGQNYRHYHADMRFFDRPLSDPNPLWREGRLFVISFQHIRPPAPSRIYWIPLRVETAHVEGLSMFPTILDPASLHRAVSCRFAKANKCPHKGFNLAQVPAVDGVKTCPMHGLRVNAATGYALTEDPAKRRIEKDEDELWREG